MKNIFSICAALLLLSFAASAESNRIVVLGAPVAEAVCALGGEKKVVGFDLSSKAWEKEYPDARELDYFRTVSSEGVLSLKPDLVLTTDQAGPAAALEQIKAAGARLVSILEKHTWDGVLEKIRIIAGELGANEKAETLIAGLQAQKEDVDARIARARENGRPSPSVLFVMTHIPASGGMTCAGDGTAAQAIIELAGGKNAVQGFKGFKPVNLEALMAANPDIILFAESPHHNFKADAFLENEALKNSRAVKDGRVYALDLSTAMNFSASTGDTLSLLTSYFHEEKDAASLPK